MKLFEVPRLADLRNPTQGAPNGAAATYRDWRNGFWKQNLNGGKPERLAGLPEERIFGYGWSHDGKSFAFTRVIHTGNVLLMSDSQVTALRGAWNLTAPRQRGVWTSNELLHQPLKGLAVHSEPLMRKRAFFESWFAILVRGLLVLIK